MTLQGFSRTAIGPAIARAAHQLLDDDPKILRDPIALALLDDATGAALRAREPAVMNRVTPARRVHFCLRSRIAEDCLARAAASGVDQYVVLGAGLDSFAYRQADWARSMTIVEVDHPRSQQFKIELLSAKGLSPPPNLVYLSVDFATETLRQRLRQAALDPARAIFVSWLGVTQYLPTDAVSNVLRALAAWPGGCALVMTYVVSDWSAFDDEARTRFNAMRDHSASVGEPWLSAYSEAAMIESLTSSGFAVQKPFATSELQSRYFAARTDGLRAEGGPSRIIAAHTRPETESWFDLASSLP